MSDTESETGSEGSSSDPLIEEEYLVEDEDGEYSSSTTTSTGRPQIASPGLGQQKVDDPYQDDPIADEEWSKRYEAEMEEEERRNVELRNRLNGKTEVRLW